jgi:hypothetical protein
LTEIHTQLDKDPCEWLYGYSNCEYELNVPPKETPLVS